MIEELRRKVLAILARLATDARCIEGGIREDDEPELIDKAEKEISEAYKSAGYLLPKEVDVGRRQILESLESINNNVRDLREFEKQVQELILNLKGDDDKVCGEIIQEIPG